MREDPIILTYSVIILLIGTITILHTRGIIATYSYVTGFALILVLLFFHNYVYGEEVLGIVKYCFLYSSIIPLVISLTFSEIIFLVETGFAKPVIFLLVTLKLNFAYLERFSSVIEIYKVYYRSKYKTYMNSLRSILGSLPYMVIMLAEYLYVNLRKLFT